MKILVVSHEFPPIGGGGANACFYLTKVFAGGSGNTDYSELSKYATERAGIWSRYYSSRIFKKTP